MPVFVRYAAVLRAPGAAPALAASLLGRLALGMTGLALLLLVRQSSGSYAAAGAVAASYAVALALAAPVRARSADRRGPVRVLIACGLLHPVALGSVVVLAALHAPALLLVVPTVLAGTTVPPLGAVMRALWGELAPGEALPTAYSLESVVVELCFVTGPVLVALLATTLGPGSAVLAAGAVTTAGALWLTSVPALRAVAPHPARPRSFAGPLVSPVVRALLLTVLAVGAGFGALEVALPAYVEEQGSRPGAAGVLLAVWSLGSVTGGLVYGGLHLPVPHTRQQPWLAAALTVGTALPLLATGPVVMGALLVGYGLAIAPFFTCNSVLVGAAAPAGTTTEAFAWNASMIFGGAALGNAVAGTVAERYGATAALLVTAATGLCVLAAALRGVAALRTA